MLDMDYPLAGEGLQRLEEYFERIGNVLGDDKRRASFATYAMGLLSDGERKSMAPIAVSFRQACLENPGRT
jgi:SRSO17 transposase